MTTQEIAKAAQKLIVDPNIDFSRSRKEQRTMLTEQRKLFKELYESQGDKSLPLEDALVDRFSEKIQQGIDKDFSTKKILDDAYTLFSDPSEITQKDKYGTALVEAASVWHGSKGKEGMKDKLWNILKSGLEDSAAVIRLSKKDDWGLKVQKEQ